MKYEVRKRLSLSRKHRRFLLPTSYFLLPSRGFTLLETILVFGILIFFGSSVIFLLRSQLLGNLEGDAETIYSRLTETQTRAISGLSDTDWGIYFNNASATPHYDVFGGQTYAGQASSTHTLSAYVEFQTPASGVSTSTVFSKLTGKVSATSTIVIRLKGDSTKTKTITVSPQGRITIE